MIAFEAASLLHGALMLSSKTLHPTSMETQTLSDLSSLSAAPQRTSHLHSASYRTLSRIFSLCHYLSHQPQPPHSSAAIEPSKSDSVLNSNTDGTSISVPAQNPTDDSAKSEIPKSDMTVQALQLVADDIDSIDEVDIDVSTNNERLNSMLSDLSFLVADPIHQNQQMQVDNMSIQKIGTTIDAQLDSNCLAMASTNEIEQLQVEEMSRHELCNETVQVSPVENMDVSLAIGAELQLESQNEISNLGSSKQDKFNDSIEEGEITDDAQDLVNGSDLDNKFEPLIDDESEDNLVDTRSDDMLATKEDMPGLEHKEVASQNPGYCPSEEVDVAGKKRKRIRAGRKEKKRKAYRIKRAQKLREDGVKRLRLPPPVKIEREKKICKYYMQGKCQQGSQCKFSHDVTPVTKSKACAHFARDECLKGDECPYDHELSKYPCHKFVSEGMCIRGANCKFSHNIQHLEDVSVLTKEPGKELSDKSNMTKQTTEGQKSSTAKLTMVDPVKNPKPGLTKSIEAPVKVPKGMQFLSLGSATKQDKHNDANSATKQKPRLMEQNPLNDLNKESENLSTQAARVSASGKLLLLETPKNFEEFMFGGPSASI